MTNTSETTADTSVDEIKIVVNSLYLSLVFLLNRIETTAGQEAAISARNELIEGLKYGNIDMAIMEDRKIFDFVLSLADRLPVPNAADATTQPASEASNPPS